MRGVRSVAMRAQLVGFRFYLNDGVLNELSATSNYALVVELLYWL